MHRLKSRSTVYRFRVAALLLCAKCLLIPITGAVMVIALILGDHGLVIVAVELLVLTVLVAMLQWLLATRTWCPLCMTAVLARKKCVTHRLAKSIGRSHRLRVALEIVFLNSFRCPYCNEPTAVEVREKKHRERVPHSRG